MPDAAPPPQQPRKPDPQVAKLSTAQLEAVLVQRCKTHLNVTVRGLYATIVGIPPLAIAAAMSSAMGEILGDATRHPDIERTLVARNGMREAFVAGLKKAPPTPVTISAAPRPPRPGTAPNNGNGSKPAA